MSENGFTVTDQSGRPIKIVYELMSGVIAWITPINIPTLKGIQAKAAEKFPYPDKRLYQEELGEAGFSQGQLTAAEDNPAYVTEIKRIDRERGQWADRAIFDYAVRFPAYPTKQDLVNDFQQQLAELREIAVLPEDDYEATLFHIVLLWNQPALNEEEKLFAQVSEYNRLVQAAIQTVALTPDEVTAGIRFFRPVLSTNRAR